MALEALIFRKLFAETDGQTEAGLITIIMWYDHHQNYHHCSYVNRKIFSCSTTDAQTLRGPEAF